MALAGSDFQYLLVADATPNLKCFPNPPHTILSSKKEAESVDEKKLFSWECFLVPGGHTDILTDFSVSCNGSWVITGAKDRSIGLWYLDETVKFGKFNVSLKLVNFISDAHVGHIASVSFFKLSQRVVTVCNEKILKLWSIIKGKSPDDHSSMKLEQYCSIRNIHNGTVNAIDVSVNDNCIATASKDKTIKIWRSLNDSIDLLGSLVGHRRGVLSIQFSPEQRLLLSGAADNDVRLWNLKDFSCIHTFEGHSHPVLRAHFFSESKNFISCDQSGYVRMWNIDKKKEILYNSDGEDKCSSSLLHNEDVCVLTIELVDASSGFYTGTDDSSIYYYVNRSEELMLEKLDAEQKFIENEQELSNLIVDKKYSHAFLLALDLDQPRRLLNILDDASSENVLLENILNESLEKLREAPESVEKLFHYACNWNMRARSSVIAQFILRWIFTNWSPREICKIPKISTDIASLLAYSSRHRQRYKKLEEQLYIMDFFKKIMLDNAAMEV